MKERTWLRYPAVLRRALPGRWPPLWCWPSLKCGQAALCRISASIRSSGCFWSGRRTGMVFCSGAACAWRATCRQGGLGYMPCPPCCSSSSSAYTILEGLRLQAADGLIGGASGRVESRPIGAMKSTIVDRIEDIEPPLAHMIPGLSSTSCCPWWWSPPCFPLTGGWDWPCWRPSPLH